MDNLTKVAHFAQFRVGQSIEVLTEKYMNEVARLHSVLVSIILDRDT